MQGLRFRNVSKETPSTDPRCTNGKVFRKYLSPDLIVTWKCFLSGRPLPTPRSGGVALLWPLDRHFAGRAPSGSPSPAAAAGEEAAAGADQLEQGRRSGRTAAA